MNELDDLLAALEEWSKTHDMESLMLNKANLPLFDAYCAFKAAEPPLVLEECKTPTNKVSWAVNSDEVIRYEGRCYRLPTEDE